ncbi:MAG: vWA domain-containing protein [Planctomycetota bacterium]
MSKKQPRSNRTSRRGAAHILIAAMLLPFIVTAALLVDFSYMQLIRTELRTASDAAAKAGAEALIRTQSTTAAKAAAVQYAALNKVGGRAFNISQNDVIIGRVSDQTNGAWVFTANATPYNAVRIDAKIGNGATTAAIPTFFAPALGHAPYATTTQATAAQQEVEVCISIDRSGSMMWDMTGGSYPPGNPLLFPLSLYSNTSQQLQHSPPHPTLSRWAAARAAVEVFLTEASSHQYPPRTALVTWGSANTLPKYPNTTYNTSSVDVALPSITNFNWSTNKTAVQTSLTNRSNLPISGGTNLSAGIDTGVSVLTGTNSRQFSNKVIILLTDGEWNQGRDPVLAAQDAANAGVKIYCVSMITGSQTVLTNVAQKTGGAYYVTSNATQLQDAFRKIAKSLPIVLTD